MKIIYLGKYNSTDSLSGPEKVANRLFNFCGKAGVEVLFIEYYFKNYKESSFYNRLWGKSLIQQSPEVYRMGVIRMLFFIKKIKPDFVHLVTEERFEILILLFSKLFKIKIISTLHGILKHEIKYSRIKKSFYGKAKDSMLEDLIFKYSKVLVFLSNHQVNIARYYFKFDNEKIKIVPNGIDETFYQSKRLLSENGKIKAVFYNGVNYDVKGIDYLLEYFNTFNPSKKWEMYIIGKEPVSLKDKGNISYYNVSIMPTNKFIDFLKDKNLYLNFSSYDSFSLTAVETMSLGLIPVVSRNVGMHEYIKNGVNGFKFELNSRDELQQIIHNIDENIYQLEDISVKVREIYNELNWTAVSEKYIELYKSFLKILK